MAIRNKRFPSGYEFSKFALGYNNVGVAGSLKPGALADCKNFNITRQGKLTKRNGCTRYQTSACGSSASVNSIYEYKSPGGQYVSTYVLIASGTVIYSYFNSKWNSVKTGLTTGLKHSFVTHLGICIGANGTNDNFKIYSDGVDLTGEPTIEALSATSFALGIPAPTTDPTVASVSSKYTRRYVDGAPATGIFKFIEFSSKLMCIADEDVYSTSAGTTWAQEYELPSSLRVADGDGKELGVYATKFYFSMKNVVNTDAWSLASWDGTTTTATHLAVTHGSYSTNIEVRGLKVFDSLLFAWGETYGASAGNDKRGCSHYNDSAWTQASDFDGTTELTYNTSSNHLEFGIRNRTTQFFEFDSHLYLIASRHDGSSWEWEVWLYNQASGTGWNKIYAGAADGYVLSGVFELNGTAYVIGNTLSSGAAADVARLYSSTDLVTWTTEEDITDMGFVFGVTEHDDEVFVLTQENTNNYSKIYRFDEDNKKFILDGIITTNAGDGFKGGLIGWANYLHVGGKDEIYTRDLTGISGKYYYKYTYKRNVWKPFEGNPSDPTAQIDLYRQGCSIGVTTSAQTDVDKIVLYRTLADGVSDGAYYKHSEIDKSTTTITDITHDDDLTTLLEENNTVPPKAKYLVLHNNRVVYLNCPDETDGGSLVMWSKASYGEAVPSANYQYFDREDGEDITGGASIGDYLVVFKRNKFSVLSGDFDEASELYTTGYGMGCTSHFTIIPFEDKVVFLSEEGWKSFDGKNLYSMSEFVNGWREDGYYTPTEAAGYQSVYYSDREQFLTLMEHSSETDIMAVGHFLIPLTMADQGAPEFGTGVLASWTYHVYANHTLTAIGTYTDSSDITRVLAGDSGGWVYELDSGTADVNAGGTSKNIAYTFQTDWSTLGTERYETKVCRRGYLAYTSSTTDTATFNIEKDFSDTDDTQTVTCVTSGVDDAHIQKLHLTGTGEVFRFTLSGSTQQSLGIIALQIYYRNLGIRP